jgi:dCMP deaminase
MFMMMARAASMRSTCFRLNVGAVLVAGDKHVLSLGYNGNAPGEPHCTGNGCVPPGSTGCQRSIHAEANALSHGPVFMEFYDNKTMYTTTSPCNDCADRMIKAGVTRVVYEGEYRDTSSLQRLIEHGVIVHRLTPSGYLVSFATGELIPE